jgi:hypothetical protein
MKINRLLIPAIVLLSFGACKQETIEPVTRKVEFVLYTTENFAIDQNVITFNLVIRDGKTILLDSALAPMKIKDIPDFSHKIMIEKKVRANNTSTLKVGFNYQIENVGISWYYDEYKAGESLKTVEFSFK